MTVAPRRTGILFAAAGTSCPEARRTFEGIGRVATLRFPGIEHRWAYTSAGVRHKLAAQGSLVNDPAQALMAMQDEGFTDVAVTSFHLSDGMEYGELVAMVAGFPGRGGSLNRLVLGPVLLAGEPAFRKVLDILLSGLPSELGEDDAVVFIAHGSLEPQAVRTLAAAVLVCHRVNRRLLMGMMLGEPSRDSIVRECRQVRAKKVWLVPLMVAAGYSVMDEIAGPGGQSWKTAFGQAGIPCIPVLKGLGEYPGIVDVWMDQTEELLGKLAG